MSASQHAHPFLDHGALTDQRGDLHQHREASEGGIAPVDLLVSNVREGLRYGAVHGWDLASQARLGRLVGELVCRVERKEGLS